MITMNDVWIERKNLHVGDTVKFYTDKFKATPNNFGCKMAERDRLVKAKIVALHKYGMELDNGEFFNYREYLLGKRRYEFFH